MQPVQELYAWGVFRHANNDHCVDSLVRQTEIAYREMRYDSCVSMLKRASSIDNVSTLSQLGISVMAMRVFQRMGRFRHYHGAQFRARERVAEIEGNIEDLDKDDLRRFLSLRSQMHIVSSTYYYYIHKDSLSRLEIGMARPLNECITDTAQWLAYHYMMGSGGLYVGDSLDVRLREMTDLALVIHFASRSHNKYYLANAYQAMAEHTLEDSLAERAQKLFEECDDIMQTAACLRTRAELAMLRGDDSTAFSFLQGAYGYVLLQHERSRSKELMWEALILKRLSEVCLSMGDTVNYDRYNSDYESCIGEMHYSEGREEREMEMMFSQRRLYSRLTIFCIIMLMQIFIIMFYWRYRGRKLNRGISQLSEELEEKRQQLEFIEAKLAKEKKENIERLTKVTLAESVIPYIDKILSPDSNAELIKSCVTEIQNRGNILTEWISMRRGNLAANITSFPLQPLLDTISRNHATFEQQNLQLIVPETSAVVKADRALTLFMLNTLCDNARKFTPQGGSVAIEVEEQSNFVEVSVKDTGIGFDESGTSENVGGGFGLANCRGIIQKYRKISTRFSVCDFGYEALAPKGSRVWFRLAKILIICFALTLVTPSHASEQNVESANSAMIHASDSEEARFVEKVNQIRQYGDVIIVLTVILGFVVVVTLVVLVTRIRQQQSRYDELNKNIRLISSRCEDLQQEYDALYCRGQILDNSLSALKHETMYYPARILQMLTTSTVSEIRDLCHYYKELYTQLLSQAQQAR